MLLISLIKGDFPIYRMNSYNSITTTKYKQSGRIFQTDIMQRRHRDINSAVKRCPTSIIIRETQIETTLRYRLTLLRRLSIRKTEITNVS